MTRAFPMVRSAHGFRPTVSQAGRTGTAATVSDPDAERAPADEHRPPQPDPVDEGPADDRRPVRGPQWARQHREAVEDDVVEGAASIRITDHGSAD
jgi:hypothetical protein